MSDIHDCKVCCIQQICVYNATYQQRQQIFTIDHNIKAYGILRRVIILTSSLSCICCCSASNLPVNLSTSLSSACLASSSL